VPAQPRAITRAAERTRYREALEKIVRKLEQRHALTPGEKSSLYIARAALNIQESPNDPRRKDQGEDQEAPRQ
jgi:hypothetical protein